MELLELIPHLASLITVGIMWQLWRANAALQATANSAKNASANSHENQRKIDVLLDDHKDIKRQQEESMEFCRKLYDQHNIQGVELAKIQKDLDEIRRKLEK